MNWIKHFFQSKNNDVTHIYNGPLEQLYITDVESIYHHLHPGTELELKLETIGDEEESQVVAYYKHFRLGMIPRAYTPVLSQLIHRGFFLKSNIAQVVREKYLPAKALSISITDQFTQA